MDTQRAGEAVCQTVIYWTLPYDAPGFAQPSSLFCPESRPSNTVQLLVREDGLMYISRKTIEATIKRRQEGTMKIGYIRVSKDKQATILQEDAMKREECKRVFTDKMTGKRFDRSEYLRMLDLARPGDVI